MKLFRIIALSGWALALSAVPVYANVVTTESVARSSLVNALLIVFLLLIFAVFFLLRRILSLTWIGALALPAVFVVGVIFDDPFQVTILALFAYFPARFLIVFFTPGRVVHGGRLQDILWYLLVFAVVESLAFYDLLSNWAFTHYRLGGPWRVWAPDIGMMSYLPYTVLVLIPLLLLHDALAGRTKTVWKFIPARLVRSRLFRPVFAGNVTNNDHA
ncbi:MAG TPA: hypothetical protein PKW95_13230 [bacterium]|nr:hypothetical protein [bacterium]